MLIEFDFVCFQFTHLSNFGSLLGSFPRSLGWLPVRGEDLQFLFRFFMCRFSLSHLPPASESLRFARTNWVFS